MQNEFLNLKNGVFESKQIFEFEKSACEYGKGDFELMVKFHGPLNFFFKKIVKKSFSIVQIKVPDWLISISDKLHVDYIFVTN